MISSSFIPPEKVRADRIHALFVRNARRFREVASASMQAYDMLENMSVLDPRYRALSDLAAQAKASMNILSARSMRLARAEIASILGSGQRV